jgi:zinc/manganese transport system substrate-binding protein
MILHRRIPAAAIWLCALWAGAGRCSAAIEIVAAENFYGDVAQEIGGDAVHVTSLLSNPDQDPHLFTVTVEAVKAVDRAQIVIYSGIGYDPWMDGLVASRADAAQLVIDVAALIHAREGDNPHIWYQPNTMSVLAIQLAQTLRARDPDHARLYAAHLESFRGRLRTLERRIAALRAKYAGTDVLATEPVFGYMAEALGFRMHALGLQVHVMNNTEPTARESGEFETLLRAHRVRVLFYNTQVADPVTARLKGIATRCGVPIVGVTETEPAGLTYVGWMLTGLDATEKALEGATR